MLVWCPLINLYNTSLSLCVILAYLFVQKFAKNRLPISPRQAWIQATNVLTVMTSPLHRVQGCNLQGIPLRRSPRCASLTTAIQELVPAALFSSVLCWRLLCIRGDELIAWTHRWRVDVTALDTWNAFWMTLSGGGVPCIFSCVCNNAMPVKVAICITHRYLLFLPWSSDLSSV